ncbi:MAG: hypothetical protein MUF03_02300 [Rubrivivax sp.]|nr:hypothetical protein [Rubrivivax sp.]
MPDATAAAIMSKLHRLLAPLQRAAQTFFVHDVTLRREEGRLQIALEEPHDPDRPRPPSAAELAAQRQRAEVDLILAQLAQVLDELPETRATLRHLVFVEMALSKKGLRALRKIPLDVLRRALDQFEGLVINWTPEGLANLRSKMAVEIIARERDDVRTEADGLDSMFAPDRIEAVLEPPPAMRAQRAIEQARQTAFADSTIERLALEFGVAAGGAAAPRAAEVEMQGELRAPSGASRANGVRVRPLKG